MYAYQIRVVLDMGPGYVSRKEVIYISLAGWGAGGGWLKEKTKRRYIYLPPR